MLDKDRRFRNQDSGRRFGMHAKAGSLRVLRKVDHAEPKGMQ